MWGVNDNDDDDDDDDNIGSGSDATVAWQGTITTMMPRMGQDGYYHSMAWAMTMMPRVGRISRQQTGPLM